MKKRHTEEHIIKAIKKHEADTKDSCSVMTPGTIQCHINNGLMNIGFSGVILKAELEGFQTEPAAIELCARSRVTITDNSFCF